MTTLRTAAQKALEFVTSEAWGTTPYMDVRVYEDAARLRDALQAALSAALAQQAEPCPNCASLEAQNDELDRKLAEMERAEPVAVVGTQVDVWRGCDGRWAPPGEPIKTALMLKDMPVGTMLYTAPPQRQPLTEEEIDAEWHELDGEASALFKRVIRKFARAIERAHGIGETK